MYPKANMLYDYAISLCGLPYRWGGNDPVEGFDCSGLVIELLVSAGVFPPNKDLTAHGLLSHFKEHVVKDASFGALLFFKPVRNIKVTHVAFALDERLMLEAGGGGSNVKTPKSAATHNAFVRIRPSNIRNDLVAIAKPPYSWERHG